MVYITFHIEVPTDDYTTYIFPILKTNIYKVFGKLNFYSLFKVVKNLKVYIQNFWSNIKVKLE